MAKDYKDLVVGLDIGTSKVLAMVAEILPAGDNPAATLKVVGMGQAATAGMRRGVVVDIEATVQSIQAALK